MNVRKRQTYAAGGLLQLQLTDATLGIARDPEASGYASVQPRQLAECRRCLAVGLLQRRTEVAVAREAGGRCQDGVDVAESQQVLGACQVHRQVKSGTGVAFYHLE